MLARTLLVCLLVFGCSPKDKGPEEMLKAIETPEYELYVSATEAYDNGFYSLSREKFQTLLFGYPASPVAELATLKIAETYFYNQLFQESITAYQSFISKFPGSKYASYARYQIGDAELAQFKGTLRDQYPLIQAADNYKQLLGRNHFLVPEGKVIKRLELISSLLLDHEEQVVEFYEKQGLNGAAKVRREELKLAKTFNSPIEVIDLLTR